MHSHQSYPNITTVIGAFRFFFKYIRVVTSIVLLSIIVPSRHTGIGAWVNSKMYTSILYNIINCHARVFYRKNQNAPRPSEHPPVVGL